MDQQNDGRSFAEEEMRTSNDNASGEDGANDGDEEVKKGKNFERNK